MKIALACKSLLLTKSLEVFLKNSISSYKKSDFVISDRKLDIDKPLFVISQNDSSLTTPFSHSSLMIELDKFYNNLKSPKDKDKKYKKKDMEELKDKIDLLTTKFKDDLLQTIQEHYEK